MKIINLKKETLAILFEIEDERLKKLIGYDLDEFAKICSRGEFKGIENEDTLSSVDAIYINNIKELYKIEAKDISKVIFFKIKGYFKVSMADMYLFGKKKEKESRKDNYKAIDMKKKIMDSKTLIERLEDVNLYIDKGYFLLLNDDVSYLLENCDPLEREELENQLILLADEIEELKLGVLELLKNQEGFEICTVETLIEKIK